MTDEAIIGTNELCQLVRVSRMQIGRWSREGLEDVAKVKRGKWKREAALSWIADRREDSPAQDGSGPSSGSLTAARTRLYNNQADRVELQNKRDAGDMAYVEEMAANVMELFAAMTESLGRLANRGTAHEQAIRREFCHEAQRYLCESVEDLVRTRAGGEGARAPGPQVSRRMG